MNDDTSPITFEEVAEYVIECLADLLEEIQHDHDVQQAAYYYAEDLAYARQCLRDVRAAQD